MGIPAPPPDPDRAWYYVELDIEVWATRVVGPGFFEYLRVGHPVALLTTALGTAWLLFVHGAL